VSDDSFDVPVQRRNRVRYVRVPIVKGCVLYVPVVEYVRALERRKGSSGRMPKCLSGPSAKS
jgi:hypothetical protein